MRTDRLILLFFLVIIPLGFGSCITSDGVYGTVPTLHGKPKQVRMIPRTVLGNPPSGPFSSHNITGILLMDTGCDYNGETALTYLTHLLERYLKEAGFGDIPFHYFIDGDGKIFAGRAEMIPAEIHEGDPFTLRKSETSAKDILMARLAQKRNPTLNLNGYLTIVFLGDYDTALVKEKQEQSFFHLSANLVYNHNIPLKNIRSLRSLYPSTKNPGFYLNNYLQSSILEKNIPPPPGQDRFMLPANRPGR